MKARQLFAFLTSAAVVTACEIGEIDLDQRLADNLVDIDEPELETFVFTSGQEDNDTKTYYSSSERTILWSSTDKIRMAYKVGEVWQGGSTSNTPKLYESSAANVSDGGAVATFSIPGRFGSSGAGEYHFFTVYPSSIAGVDFSSAPPYVEVTLPTEQTPTATSFDPAADFMVGHSTKTYDTKPTEAIPLVWDRLVAHGEITLKNLTSIDGFSSNEEIQSVTLTAQSGAELTGKYNLNITTGELSAMQASNSVTVDGDNLTFSGSNLTFWVAMLPVTLTSLDVTLETNEAYYTRSIDLSSNNITFPVNAHRTLGIKMETATRTEKPMYVKVTENLSDWSGDYLIVYESRSIALDGSRTTLDAEGNHVAVTIENNKIAATSEVQNVQFTIASVTGGYSIKSASGYYIGNNAYSNTLLSSQTDVYTNTISYSSGEVSILASSTSGNTTLRFNDAATNGNRFRFYKNGQQAIQLYKLNTSSGGSVTPELEATAIVETADAGSITQSSATLTGSWFDSSGTISEAGFYWGTSPEPDEQITFSGTPTNPFNCSLEGLSANTTYYFRAYVMEYNASEGAEEERLGDVNSFTTEEAPVILYYEKITSALSDWSGRYVLGYLSSNTVVPMTSVGSINGTSVGLGGDALSVDSGRISYTEAPSYELTINKEPDGNYTILLNSKYLNWSSGNTLSEASSISSNSKWKISYDNGLTIANVSDNTRKLQYNSQNPRFACYSSSLNAPSLFKLISDSGSDIATATVITSAASSISGSSAILHGSYYGETGEISQIGFYWGTNSSNLSAKVTANGSSSFNYTLSGLTAGQTYYYKAFVVEYNASTSSPEERLGDVQSFYAASGGSTGVSYSLLEIPTYSVSAMSSTTTSSLSDLYKVTHTATISGATDRNYTLLYDPEMYASYWVAYPLTSTHLGTGRDESWGYDPVVPQAKQTKMSSGLGVSISTPNYTSNSYARGHQIPDADRSGVSAMQAQTYYYTNMTPQIQNGFNGGIWSQLEKAVRDCVSGADTVYVVTGAAFRKVGGSETITKIKNKNDNKMLPVPNYYWKALLKVTWSGSGKQKTISSASGVGFWLPHDDLKGKNYSSYVQSIDQIEAWTGIDLFSKLPDGIESTVEANTNWTSFQNF